LCIAPPVAPRAPPRRACPTQRFTTGPSRPLAACLAHASVGGEALRVIDVVRDGVTYHLRAPGKFVPPTWIPVLPTVMMIAATGAILGGSALLGQEDSSQKTTGGVLVGVGLAVAIGGGILYYDASRGARQDGATTEWNEPVR
ncbi:MAG: hypothetical protein L6Q84_35995, partial [Polyangiaceae bacterium]|nr:hypothetical protein [Polyangiaceae bacterium]